MRRQIIALMRANGYWLKRSNGKHYVWTNGVHLIVTAKSPSDWRAMLNIRKEVERRRKTA